MLETINGTKLKIDLISYGQLKELPPDFEETSLIIDKRDLYCRNKSIDAYKTNTLKRNKIITNLIYKSLTFHPVSLTYGDAVLFKVNRLIKLQKNRTKDIILIILIINIIFVIATRI